MLVMRFHKRGVRSVYSVSLFRAELGCAKKKQNTQSIVIGQVIKTLKYLEFNLRETARTEVYVESC